MSPAFTYNRRLKMPPLMDGNGNPLAVPPPSYPDQPIPPAPTPSPMSAELAPPEVAQPQMNTPPPPKYSSSLENQVPASDAITSPLPFKPTSTQRWTGYQPPPSAPPVNAANGAMQLPQSPTPRTPGILQRIGAAAMGAGIGYVNAAGRSRIDPQVAQAAEQGILHPGYAQKVGDYQRRVQQIQGQSQLNSDAAKDQHTQAQAKLATQQAATLEAEGRYAPNRDYIAVGGGLFNAKTGQWAKQPIDKSSVMMIDPEEGKRLHISPMADGTYGIPKEAAAAYFNNQPGGAKGKYNLQKVTVRRPGSESVEDAYADPRNPGRLISFTGEELPEGTVSVNSAAESAKTRQDSFGEFGNYYRAARGQGMAESDARKYAGDLVFKKLGVTLGAQEQNMAIKGELSGIGGGASLPTPPSGSPTPPTPRAAAPGAPGAPGAPKPNAAPPKASSGLSDKDRGFVNQYLGQLTGIMPAGAGGQAGQVGSKRGMTILANLTGLDPMSLNAELSENKGLAKSINDAIQVSAAFGRVQETLKKHGQVLIDAAKAYDPTGYPLANRSVQWIQENAAAHPELQKYDIALAALQREYSRLIAGGVQSKAMLPVSAEEKGTKIIRRDATMADIVATVQQLKVEADTEQAAFGQQIDDLKGRQRNSPVGQAVAGGGNQPSSSLSVTFNGHVYGPFKDQAAMNQFKSDMGIK